MQSQTDYKNNGHNDSDYSFLKLALKIAKEALSDIKNETYISVRQKSDGKKVIRAEKGGAKEKSGS